MITEVNWGAQVIGLGFDYAFFILKMYPVFWKIEDFKHDFHLRREKEEVKLEGHLNPVSKETHENMFNIANYYRNANQNYNEIPLHTSQYDYY